MEASPDSSEEDSETMEESPHEGLKVHAGPSHEDLGAMEKPSQADLKTCSGPDKEVLGALSRVPEVDFITCSEWSKANLMSFPINFLKAREWLQDCLGELPEKEPMPSQIDSISKARLSQVTKVCLRPKTEDQRLLPKESVERAQTKSSVRQGTEGSQTRSSQASFPLGEAQKPPQNSEMQTTPITPHKLEEPQTSTFQGKPKSGKKKKVKSRISHEKSQDDQFQSLTTNSQTENPQPVFRPPLTKQSSSQPSTRLKVAKHLRFYSHIRCYMNKGLMLKIMSAEESGLLKKGKFLHVCDKFLIGKCQDDLNCPGYHTLFPFHWEFFSKADNSWKSVCCGTQLHLEMLYADPNNSKVNIFELDGFTTTLDMMLKSFSKYSRYSFCRRISCVEDSFFASCNVSYMFDGKVWTLFNKNEQHRDHNLGLEETVTTDDRRKVLPNYSKPEGEQAPLICTRPRYTPLHLLVQDLSIWNLKKLKDRSVWDEDDLDLSLDNYPELNMKNQRFILMEILPSESTYQYCCRLFYISMNPQQSVVLRIFRLYNPELWEQYKREAAKMRAHKAVSTSMEYHLFHETSMSLEDLAANGLESKLSSYDGILGYGTYFSLHAKTASLMNSVYNPKFGHVMVLAKVLVGENTVGRPGLWAPPFKPDGQQFDSCVNNIDLPTLFLIFKEKYIFPQFIILYKYYRESVSLVF